MRSSHPAFTCIHTTLVTFAVIVGPALPRPILASQRTVAVGISANVAPPISDPDHLRSIVAEVP